MLVDYQKVQIYQADTLVLKDVDFQVEEGEFIYLIGKVGSGKSSLLKTIYCELDIHTEAVSYTHLTLPTTLHECRSRWSPYH